MNFIDKWAWRSYALVLSWVAVAQMIEWLLPNSAMRFYYSSLMAFSSHFQCFYYLNIASIFINLACLYPLTAHVWQWEWHKGHLIWKGLFFVRIGTDLAGHNYEIQFLKSILADNVFYGALFISAFILTLLPSYVAHFLFAFPKANNTPSYTP